MKGKPTGIEGLDNLSGGHGNAGSIPAFDDNYGRDLQIAKCPLKDTQALFQGGQGFFKGLIVNSLC
jgi:hypothetical protein